MSLENTRLFVAGALALLIAGCNEEATRYPVAGKILIDGQPVTMGSVQFVPERGKPVAGKIGSDGSFRLAELSVDSESSKPGVAAGKYRVAISSAEIVNEDEGEMLHHVPEKYADHRTSELEVEIRSPQEDMLIELTWEGARENEEEEVSSGEAEAGDEAGAEAEADQTSQSGDAEATDQEASNEE